MNPSPFGVYLRQRRTAAGRSLREVAAHLGISHVYLGEVERGRRRTLQEHHWDALVEIIDSITTAELRIVSAQSEPLDATKVEEPGRGVVLALARKLDEDGITEAEADRILNILKSRSEEP